MGRGLTLNIILIPCKHHSGWTACSRPEIRYLQLSSRDMTEILFLKTRTKSIWRYYHNYDKRLCYCPGFPHYWLVCIDKLSLNLVYAFYCYQSVWLTTFLLSLIVCCLCAHLPLTFWLLHRKLTIELILTKLISQHRWLPCPVIGWDIFDLSSAASEQIFKTWWEAISQGPLSNLFFQPDPSTMITA